MAERQDGTDKLVNHFEVNWGAAGFDLFTDSPENCGYCGGAYDPERFEATGNIYENPELLTPPTNS